MHEPRLSSCCCRFHLQENVESAPIAFDMDESDETDLNQMLEINQDDDANLQATDDVVEMNDAVTEKDSANDVMKY